MELRETTNPVRGKKGRVTIVDNRDERKDFDQSVDPLASKQFYSCCLHKHGRDSVKGVNLFNEDVSATYK